MKRFIVCFLLSACIMAGVFAQEQRNFVIDYPFTYRVDNKGYWTFTEGNQITWKTYNPYGNLEAEWEGRYTVEYESGVPFLNIVWDDNRRDRYLLLWYTNSSTFMLYDSDSNCFTADAADSDYYMSYPMAEATDMSATSSLTEGATVYSPDISNLAIGKPWVEGVAGHGIGEKISMNTKDGWGANALYISIGFVSYRNPQLYQLNSRPSKIRIHRGSISFDVDLEDTPHFQRIELRGRPGIPSWVTDYEPGSDPWYDPETDTVIENPHFIQIEILDVYPGTRWQDTAINAIFYATSTWQ
jgi:hypothetical protein